MSDLQTSTARRQRRTSQQLLHPVGSWRRRLKPLVVPLISALWLRWYRFRLGDRVRFGRGFITNGKLVIKGPGRVEFGDNVNAWAHAEKNVLFTYTPESRITVGARTRLNGAGVMAHSTVEIGPDCILGSTILIDSDFHPLDPERRHDPGAPVAYAPIIIGRNVWLGGQSAVLKGVTFGENSVAGFRAVVTGDVPPNVVVAGNPARVVRELASGDQTSLRPRSEQLAPPPNP